VVDRTLAVASAHGLHARPAALFVKSVVDAGHTVHLAKGPRTVNAASILGVVSLGIEHGDEVTLTVEGDQAEAVLDELAAFLEQDHDAA
jgi:phosphocarrier protein HPr